MRSAMKAQSSRNVRLLAHHPLDGFGNCGEGMAIQRCRDGRRVLWIAHESAPKNVTAVDVTNPKKPALITQIATCGSRWRCFTFIAVSRVLTTTRPPPSTVQAIGDIATRPSARVVAMMP